MKLYKRKNTYWTDFAVQGQRFRQSLDTSDWRKAESKAKLLVAAATEGKLSNQRDALASIDFRSAIASFLESRKTEIQEPRFEKAASKPLLDFFGMRKLKDI